MYSREIEEIKQHILKASELLAKKPMVEIESSQFINEVVRMDDEIYVYQENDLVWTVVLNRPDLKHELPKTIIGHAAKPHIVAKLAVLAFMARKVEDILEIKEKALDS